MQIRLPRKNGRKKISNALSQIQSVIDDLEKGLSECEQDKAVTEEKITKKRAEFEKFERLMQDKITSANESQKDAENAIRRFKAMLEVPEVVEENK